MIRQKSRVKAVAHKVVSAMTTSLSPKKRKKASSTDQFSSQSIATSSIVKSKKAKTTASMNIANQTAWSAFFSANKKTTSCQHIRPMAGKPISPELQAKIDLFPSFHDVSKRSADTSGTKLVAWNINGLRAMLKRDNSVHLCAYVAQEDPDLLCLSETKICSQELQKLEDCLPQYPYQYWSCAVKKGYASTAILSKRKPLSVVDTLVVGSHASKGLGKAGTEEKDQEGRFLALEFDRFWLIHTYVPNAGGQLERLEYRVNQWDKAILRELKALEKSKPVIWCGDLNVAHQEIDIHNPKGNRKSAGFTEEERTSFSNILDNGFVDTFRHLHPDKVEYSYFGYRHNMRAKNKGWRLDYFVVSNALMPHVRSSFIRQSVDGSDHLPIGLELEELL